MSWLRLIRWKNLVIILLTQLIAWWCVVAPLASHFHIQLLLTPLHFSVLAVSTALIAAAGYMINDYFDLRIDIINKPDKVILDRHIPRRMAIIVHSVLNITALLMAASLALPAGHPEWLLLQLTWTVLLWRYSTRWKRQFAIGNVVVALMTALTVVALIIYEPAVQVYLYRAAFIYPDAALRESIPNPAFVLWIYAFFAFMLTWIREIVKDMEDYKGNAQEGCVTMPIKWGLLRSARFVQALSAVVILILSYAAIRLWQAAKFLDFSALYIWLLLVLPLVIWTVYLPTKATAKHYHLTSRWLKIIMVSGIISLLFFTTIDYG